MNQRQGGKRWHTGGEEKKGQRQFQRQVKAPESGRAWARA